jgi:natural product biosynthesis luciferase-like monooxygenase protein
MISLAMEASPVPEPAATTLSECLERFASREPRRTLFSWLHPDGDRALTVGELDRQARAGAFALERAGVLPGDRVLLLFPQGLDFIVAFMSCSYRGAVAVTSPFPTRPLERVLPRLRSIARDCRPAAVLSSLRGDESVSSDLVREAPELAVVPWLCLADAPAADHTAVCRATGDATAFLQYTSGSTAEPRGVVVSHANVIANCRAMRQPAGSRILSWLPQYHDFGLIYGILNPLVTEVDSVLMAPGSFVRRPLSWLEAIGRVRATHSPAPNFAFEMCVRSAEQANLTNLDLSSWRAAAIGAEPIRIETIERFLAVFGRCGLRRSVFVPAYGLAEATLMVTRRPHDVELRSLQVVSSAADAGGPERPRRLVSCGTPYPETRVIIVDPDSRAVCEPGSTGEIWVAGPSVASGYFERPLDDQLTFGAFTADGAGPFLRTGDLGLLHDGELYVAGRRKEVIVVRGAKHHPEDIEATIERCHPEIHPAGVAAFGASGPDGEGVGVVVEVAPATQKAGKVEGIVDAIRRAVAVEHGLTLAAVDVVAPGQIPKTTSGKRRRLECRARFEERQRVSTAAVKPTSEDVLRTSGEDDAVAHELARLVAAISRRNPPPLVEPATLLRDVGLDSVMFAELGAELASRYGVEVPLSALFEFSVAGLAERVRAGSARPRTNGDAAPSPAHHGRAAFELTVEAVGARRARAAPARRALDFTVFCFGDLGEDTRSAYDLIVDSAKLADQLGFTAIWLPERHFHPFGGISPNPAVLAAALSRLTQRLRLRAGSVILPLHHPLRVAEEWAVIDNLSSGRVDLAFGWGWNPNDFVLAPERFSERRDHTLAGIENIERLWRGGRARAPNGQGVSAEFRLYPRPVQAELPVWLTCTRSPESFITAGACGYNVLTALLFQSVEELAAHIALYRAARAQNGHDPNAGVVSVMLHTLLGSDEGEVCAVVREPFTRYLSSSRTLWKQGSERLDQLDEAQRQVTLERAFERYHRSAALFGTPRSTAALALELGRAGVDEIACLIDFGVRAGRVLEGLHHLDDLRRICRTEPESAVAHAE